MAREYRREKGGNTWHFCTNCPNWPTTDYEKRRKRPRKQLCEKCKRLEEGGCNGEQAPGSKPDPRVWEALERLERSMDWTRWLVPYLEPGRIGKGCLAARGRPSNAPLLVFPQGVSTPIRQRHNEAANVANENFLIRLYAILERHGFTRPIDDNADNAEIVKLLKDLRNYYAHGSGVYDPRNSEHEELRTAVVTSFDDLENVSEDVIPLDVDRVLGEFLKRCRKYVKDVMQHR